MTNTFLKDPDDVLDFQIDWSTWLDSDTISTSNWALEAGDGLTMDSDSNTDTTATVWVSAGIAGLRYTLRNEIVTVGGRTKDDVIHITVREAQ